MKPRLEPFDKIALGFVVTTAAVAAVGYWLVRKLDDIVLENLDNIEFEREPVAYMAGNNIYLDAKTLHGLKRAVQKLDIPLEQKGNLLWGKHIHELKTPNQVRRDLGLDEI